ncbi:UDP-glucose--tetrahydrobiopterin glucosyltransferase [Aphanothece hegewaldii CCALA 016]|uniref:UDP-glucose--tetrahydrobiopterin glucosyltransferase n=1 Tax=Aphanothece hegewaldii CCALA 016 TaxID=2107694 RepID=A0A2T1M003_9CHRO|nr:glycosyltransferase family 4 protein [Aphanothece hegewaldii]PSF37967.1 UDP-glucose--tetrahydrobiopterin glucosyltransferase [Aphanothece hegewaldii CCALA 016]
MLKLLFVSTPVGPLSSGIGGGVEFTLYNLALIMSRRGHHVQVVAPEKSTLPNTSIIEIAGNLQISAQSQERDEMITLPPNSVLGNMWDYARQVQDKYDLIFNFSYDWLPFYLTPFFTGCRVGHLVSMGSVSEAMDEIIRQTVRQFPHQVTFYSQTQADTFGLKNVHCLGSAIDLPLYEYVNSPDDYLAWVGRIAPEKALEDAVAAAQITGIPLKIFGKLQDNNYWQQIQQDYSDAPFEYMGFFPTDELQKYLGKARALLMTPRWVEAFGNVMIEALACGVPVIAYRRGGPIEVVQDGKTGFLVEPDSVTGLVEAIQKINTIDRAACRRQAEQEYSLEALGDRTEQWFSLLLC